MISLLGPIKIQGNLWDCICFMPFSREEGWDTQFRLINQEKSIN